ncbi:MAG TPA: SGNH/GDSL hydrolase family protein, partial [Isosphaeraceae bacterium]|nr:SGNH/GDSL hydrolase family protein [Isosphaeraceae bacterium]
AFPIHGTDWKKITVAWKDLIPVLPGARSLPLAVSGPNRPSRFSGLWVGKWWYWGDYPELTFALDEIRLEPKVPRDPKCAQPEGRPLDRVLKKLEAGQPITIVTMGDSLTDKRHWANREAAWVDLLKARLEKTYQTKVTMVNVAIGGTQLRQNLVLIPRWIDQCPEPDLVTIGFGFNDWDAGMRAEEFKRGCREAIDRIRCATRGHADVLLMTTNPASIRWNEMEELASACREAARDSRAGLADTDRAFLQAGETDRDSLFVRDGVHLSQAGHALVAEVFRSLESRDP